MSNENQNNKQLTNLAFLQSYPHIYSLIIQNLPIGFTLVDKEGDVVEFNPAAETLTGYSRDEVIGKSHFEILHSSKDSISCPLFTHVFEKHASSIALETRAKRKNGETINLAVTVFPLLDSSGNLIGGAELFRDVTVLKQLESERKNLLSMFAHDMKNPVVAASGFLARINSEKVGPLTKKQKEYLAIIMEAIKRLQRLVSDFLDYSRIEGRKYKPVLGIYNLKESIYKQIETIKIEADKKNIQIIFECAQKDLPTVHADATMVDRVFSNLIDNAIKYTNPGGVVTVKIVSKDESVIIEVSDTGIGIDDKDMPCVFDPFCRVNREGEGSGLGLSIAKAIVEAHHGTISVESIPGKGSKFWFSLPNNVR